MEDNAGKERQAAGNVNQPLGTLYGRHQAFNIQANGQLKNAASFRPLIVAYRNGNPVRLEQLGHVLDSVQNDKGGAWFNSERAVLLAIQRQPGANTVQVVVMRTGFCDLSASGPRSESDISSASEAAPRKRPVPAAHLSFIVKSPT